MFFTKSGISDLLYNTSRMFAIATEDEVIHNALTANNFTDPKIDALITTWGKANDDTETHKKAIKSQKRAKIRFKKNLWDANASYSTHVKYAKNICFEDPEKWAKLGLSENRKRKFNDMLLQTSVFYSNVLEDPDLVIAYDEKFGETQVDIENSQQSMVNVNVRREKYITAIGKCQALKAQRDGSLKTLFADATGFLAVLRKVLRNNLQHLEKVKVKVYSPGYKKKKKETDPPATEPPATEPPSAEPPATEPPATEPPVTDPPTTDPPTTDPVHDPNPGQ